MNYRVLKIDFPPPLRSVQSSFRIMDMCHSRPTNAIFDALNQNTIHFSRPPVAPAVSSGLPLGYSNIPVHTQVTRCSMFYLCVMFQCITRHINVSNLWLHNVSVLLT